MKSRRMQGFTLMETLIALVLMSLLLVALFGGFRAGIASWRMADVYIEESEPQVLLNRMLYRHFSSLYLPPQTGFFKFMEVQSLLRGSAERVNYIAPLALAVDSELYSIELASEPDGRQGVWIKYLPYEAQLNMQKELDAVEYELVSDVLKMRLSYFVETDWVEELEEGVTPALVRVQWHSNERRWSDSVYRVLGTNHAE